MIKIGDFSKLSKISIRMLRHYDEMGLLIPESIDPFSGYRYYEVWQLTIANRITALKDMGFSLAAIAVILDKYKEPAVIKEYLLKKQSDTLEEAEVLNRRMLLLETTINRLGKDETVMEYNVVLKELPARKVASIRKIIPSYFEESILWGLLAEETVGLDLKVKEPSYGLAVFHDKEYKEKDVDVEIQVSVIGDYKDTKSIIFKEVPAIQIASATYTGSYEQETQVNESVARWVQDNGYEYDGCNFSIYHVSPHEVSNPDEYVTEVCIPVKKKKSN